MPETLIEPTVEAPVVETPAVATPPVDSPKLTILRRGDQVVEQPPAPAAEPVVAAPIAPPVAPDPAVPTPTPPPVIEEEEEVDFFPYASEQTNGAISSPEDVFNLLEESRNLKKKLAERPQIEFPNEQAKWLYEQAIKFPGQEKDSFRSTLHVLSLDVTKLSHKEKQFEAFALENKELTREEAREYFEARYEKTFGNDILETDKSAQYDHLIQTKKATETLTRMQEEFSKLEPSKPAASAVPQLSPEEQLSIKQDVSKVLGQFGGVKYQFLDDPNSTVNVPMEDAELTVMENYMTDPRIFFEDLTKECTDPEGNFSMEELAMAMFEFKNRHRIREQAFKSGVTFGKLEQIKTAKNTSTPQPAPTPSPAPANKSYTDAFREAAARARQNGNVR